MSDLQLALIAFGVVLVGGVAIYNAVQERQVRNRAEKAFGSRPPDALFGDSTGRREPTIGEMPVTDIVEAAEEVAAVRASTPPPASVADDADTAPASEIYTRVDTVAVILADEPILSEQTRPPQDALGPH